MIYDKNRDSKYQINGHNYLSNNTNDIDNDNSYDKAYINLSKGKMIKFNYNGSEFFFILLIIKHIMSFSTKLSIIIQRKV